MSLKIKIKYKLKQNKHIILLCLKIFFLCIIIKVIGEKIIGNGYIGYVGPYDPLDWGEIFDNLPQTLFVSVLLTIAFAWVYIIAKKIDDKKWDDIRKKNSNKNDAKNTEI